MDLPLGNVCQYPTLMQVEQGNDNFTHKSEVCTLQAGLCDDATTNLMGEGVDLSKKGTFFLRTNPQSPYAMPFKSSGVITVYSTTLVGLTIFASQYFI